MSKRYPCDNKESHPAHYREYNTESVGWCEGVKPLLTPLNDFVEKWRIATRDEPPKWECTREGDHVCRVNGPCNGFPKGSWPKPTLDLKEEKHTPSVVKNKSTEENREFWEHCETTAEEVRHWPKWMGGEGVPPESEYGKQLGHMHSAQVIQGDDGEYFVVPQASTSLSRQQLEDLANALKNLESVKQSRDYN